MSDGDMRLTKKEQAEYDRVVSRRVLVSVSVPGSAGEWESIRFDELEAAVDRFAAEHKVDRGSVAVGMHYDAADGEQREFLLEAWRAPTEGEMATRAGVELARIRKARDAARSAKEQQADRERREYERLRRKFEKTAQ